MYPQAMEEKPIEDGANVPGTYQPHVLVMCERISAYRVASIGYTSSVQQNATYSGVDGQKGYIYLFTRNADAPKDGHWK